MNTQEAIKLMLNEIVCINTADHNECERDCANCDLVKDTDELLEAYSMAIKSLEKQIPKKPETTYSANYSDEIHKCPTCNGFVDYKEHHCKCGQNLKWSDEE